MMANRGTMIMVHSGIVFYLHKSGNE